MKKPSFLKKFFPSTFGSQQTGKPDPKGRISLSEAREIDSEKILAAERKALYIEEKLRSMEEQAGVLEREKQGLVSKLDVQLQQCDSLRQENKTLEERLYAAIYSNADEFVLDTNFYEKGQLVSSRHRESDLEHENNWLLPYSDFMTLLLVVFVVFYGLAVTDSAKLNDITAAISKNFMGGESGVFVERERPLMRVSTLSGGDMDAISQPEVIDDLKKEVLSSFKKFNLGENLFVDVSKDNLTIRLRDKVTFYPGKSTLMLTSTKLLEEVGKILMDYPGRKVLIEGHTDSVPISNSDFGSNWDLSSGRAVSLVRYFVEKAGLPPERFTAVGLSQYQPVASNSTAEGRAANRRVEIKLQIN
ncbi:Flagellar motor rotation protein MotB [hydrothermal vent metagenome]|uniref:Flagellar motor rotation protein MotB n=1 Tax=hydrothermal vent metagenome TaxID=652676 RepID=A0A3B0R9Y4_9ZZZZ